MKVIVVGVVIALLLVSITWLISTPPDRKGKTDRLIAITACVDYIEYDWNRFEDNIALSDIKQTLEECDRDFSDFTIDLSTTTDESPFPIDVYIIGDGVIEKVFIYDALNKNGIIIDSEGSRLVDRKEAESLMMQEIMSKIASLKFKAED